MFRKTMFSFFACVMAMGMMMSSAVFASSNPTPAVGGEFPIGIFYEPPATEATNADYADIRAMNANFIVASNNTVFTATPAKMDYALELAAANNLKFLVTDSGIRWFKSEWISQNDDAGTGVYLRDDQSIGQTFTTGPALHDAPFKISFKKSGDWLAGTSAKLSIYDSVAKTTLITSSTIGGPIASSYPEFTILGVYVSPNTTYYMELTTESTTNVGPFKTSSSNAYSGGQAYVNGTPQANDLYFQITLTTDGGIHEAFTPTSRPSDDYLEKFVNHYKSNPALLGYNLIDEPFANKFPMLKQATDIIRTLDPDHMVYTNLYGITDESNNLFDGTPDPVNGTYDKYVNGWLATDPDMISFDIYPYTTDGFLDKPYYQSLEYFRQQSLLNGTDFWAYIQSMSYDTFNFVEPSESQLKYQIYSTLAYGAKGYVYFTYNTPSGFDNGLILPNGTKNDTYDYAKNINGEVLKLGSTLLSLTSKDVYHTGTVPPFGTALPGSYFWQPTAGQPEMPMIVSRFENEDGRQFVMIVNKDLENAHTGHFTLSTAPSAVTEVSKTTGLEVATTYNAGTGTMTADFAPGEGRLFALSEPEENGYATALTSNVISVDSGKTFKVKYRLDSVAAAVYAQDVSIAYDPAAVEFVSAASVKSGVSLLETGTSSGSIQLILASTGAGNAVAAAADIVELTFRSKFVSQATSSEIRIESATLADGQGDEHEAAVSAFTIQIAPGLAGDLNLDNKVTVGDLALIAVHYGKDTNSPDWSQIEHIDLNHDGKIDIEDLVLMARMIRK